VLLAQELPAEVTEQMLGVLFGRFAGFQEIRMAGQRGIAFIEVRVRVGWWPGLSAGVGLGSSLSLAADADGGANQSLAGEPSADCMWTPLTHAQQLINQNQNQNDTQIHIHTVPRRAVGQDGALGTQRLQALEHGKPQPHLCQEVG
jgi:hypothetical protein